MEPSTSYASVFSNELLRDRVALLTGGGTGIGRAIAHELAALGATTIISARRPEVLEATATEIVEAGGRADHIAADIRDEESVKAMVSTAVERHGRIDLLVNNAGGQFPAPAEQISVNGWRTVVDLNLTGTFLVTREVFNASMSTHGGAICSIVADMWNGFPYMAHSGAARAGVENMTKSLAVEWGPRGVRVNAVAPGMVYSSGMDTYAEEVQAAAAANAAKIPVGRVGTESETSAAVVFLLSPAAAFITGETLKVDGGGSLAKTQMVPLTAHGRITSFDGFHLAREIPPHWRGEEPPSTD